MSDEAVAIQVPDYLQHVLDEFDSRRDIFEETALADALLKAAKPHWPLSDNDRRAYVAEEWAFSFRHSAIGGASPWDTHFGPFMSGKTEAGEVKHVPDIGEIDGAVISYWEVRRDSARHPVMRARYADLLWDLRNLVTVEPSNVDDARAAVDAYLQAVGNAPSEPTVYSVLRLQRALDVAVSISDCSRVEVVRDAMFGFYDRAAVPEKIGTWTWLFDTLGSHKKVALTDEQWRRMLGDLERTLDDATKVGGEMSAWRAEAAAERLRSHYTTVGKQNEVKRVVLAYGGAFEAAARQASGAVAMAWLQNVHDDYRSVGLKDEADEVLLLSKEKAKEARTQTQTVETKFEISQQEVDAIVGRFTEGKLEDALGRIALQFVPRMDQARDMMQWTMENTPFLALVGHTVIGEDQIIAQIGSTESDEEGRLIMHLREDINSKTFYLAAVIDGTRRKFDCAADDIMGFVACGSLSDPQRHPLVREGVAAYLDGDHVKAVHVLVPQIEHALRILLAGLGQPTNKPMRSTKGVMQEKTLTDILEYEPAIDAWAEKNRVQDWLAYLRCFLTDPRGRNLRNRLAHGLMGQQEFGRQVSDRVLHLLLMLSLIDRRPAAEGVEEQDG